MSFAKDVGASLIAEGVETAEELSALERLGAHWVQGFHIARPQPLRVYAGGRSWRVPISHCCGV